MVLATGTIGLSASDRVSPGTSGILVRIAASTLYSGMCPITEPGARICFKLSRPWTAHTDNVALAEAISVTMFRYTDVIPGISTYRHSWHELVGRTESVEIISTYASLTAARLPRDTEASHTTGTC